MCTCISFSTINILNKNYFYLRRFKFVYTVNYLKRVLTLQAVVLHMQGDTAGPTHTSTMLNKPEE